MTSAQQINLLYLVNNCGYERSNELWTYNINRNQWNYVKPYIVSVERTQQKPCTHFGHTAVISEKIETLAYNKAFTRKYMVVYGGYSLYCQHVCSDMWIYEISYGPQRFYPNSYYTENPGTIFWKEEINGVEFILLLIFHLVLEYIIQSQLILIFNIFIYLVE